MILVAGGTARDGGRRSVRDARLRLEPEREASGDVRLGRKEGMAEACAGGSGR